MSGTRAAAGAGLALEGVAVTEGGWELGAKIGHAERQRPASRVDRDSHLPGVQGAASVDGT